MRIPLIGFLTEFSIADALDHALGTPRSLVAVSFSGIEPRLALQDR
jgi:hypothetical protein